MNGSATLFNGRLKKIVSAGAVAAALVSMLMLAGYLWPWVSVAWDQFNTIRWVNQLRAARPHLIRDAAAWNDLYNGMAARDERLKAAERMAVDIEAIKAALAKQEGMLEVLMIDRGLMPPKRPLPKED
jgi:hypothetical protein